jgi:hypothetical protein
MKPDTSFTSWKDLLLIVDSQRRSIRLAKEAVRERELRKESELQEALSLLAERQEGEPNVSKAIPIGTPNSTSFARKIGDDVRSFFIRPLNSAASPPGPFSPLTPREGNSVGSDSEAGVEKWRQVWLIHISISQLRKPTSWQL